MVDGQEKTPDTSNEPDQACKETCIPDEHKERYPQKLGKAMSETSNVLTLFFSLCLVVASFLTFLAICVQAFIYNSQLKEMKKSTNAATDAAKAAKDSVTLARENARLDQRAWIAPIHFKGVPRVNQTFEVRVEYKNTGKTFAKNVRPVFFAYGVPKGEKPDFGIVENEKLGDEGAKFLLPPNGETTSYHKVNGGRPLSPEEFRQIESGEIVIFAFGKIYYADIFGCAHWIKFSTYLDWNIQGYSAYNEYDDADDNCSPSAN